MIPSGWTGGHPADESLGNFTGKEFLLYKNVVGRIRVNVQFIVILLNTCN